VCVCDSVRGCAKAAGERERERERERFALPKVHPVLLLRLARPRPSPAPPPPCSGTLSDILGPPFSPLRPILSHPMVSPLFSPTYLYPPHPLARPVSAGQPSVAAGRLLFVDTATPVHQMVGRWICACVSMCVRASHKRVCAISLSLSLYLSSLSLSLSLSLCMHRRGALTITK